MFKSMFLKVLFVLAIATGSLFAQGAPGAVTAAPPIAGLYCATSVDGVGDTLKTAVDSVVLLSNQYFSSGYDYILSRSAITFAGTDSVKVQVRLRNMRNNMVTYVDTFLLGTAEQILLPINRTTYGDRFTLALIGLTGSNTKLILGNMEILRRRTVVIEDDGTSKSRNHW